MDSRVEALSLVTSGGKRNGAHSYSSDMSVSQPAGNPLRRGADPFFTAHPKRAR